MNIAEYNYQKDFSTAKQHHMDFWNRTGMVMSITVPLSSSSPRRFLFNNPEFAQMHQDSEIMAEKETKIVKNTLYFCDALPFLFPDYGTVALAQLLGSSAKAKDNTVWYKHIEIPGDFSWDINENTSHWMFLKHTFQTLQRQKPKNAIISAPAYTPGLDTLATLEGDINLLMDLVDRPSWVHNALQKINQLYAKVLNKTMKYIEEDGGSGFAYYEIWGKGRTTQMQCDLAATISPGMFDEFVVPYLREQCQLLDHSLFHVDGTQALPHLDSLLEIPELTAIEWTPQAGTVQGGNPKWYDLYHRVLDSGKSVQIVAVSKDEIRPLIQEIGNKGVFLLTSAQSIEEALEMEYIFNSLR